MKKSKVVLLLLDIISFFILNIINIFVFNSVISMYLFNCILFLLIGVILFHSFRRKRKALSIKISVINISLVVIIYIAFYLIMPKYSFKKAQNIILTNEKPKVLRIEGKTRMNIKMINSPNFLVGKAYLIYVSGGNGEIVYIFNPIRGDYQIIK